MAILLADGFDFYAAAADITLAGTPWTSYNGSVPTPTTPYGVGRACQFAGGNSLTSVTVSNETTIYLAFNLYSASAFTGLNTQGFWITLMETAGNQVTLHWAQDGNFYVRAGSNAGTIIGTFAHGMSITTWAHWQCKVVINNTTGSVELRKDNSPANVYTVTGLNTRNGTANAYANKVFIQTANILFYLDDMFVHSSSGGIPNNWPGQLRAVQLMPNADTAQKNLLPSAGATTVLGTNSAASTMTQSANTIYFPPTNFGAVFVAIGGTASKITAKLNAGFTGKMKCAIYTIDGSNLPSTLVGQTNEVTNPILGDNDFTFASPPTLTDGTSYCIGFWSDTAAVINSSGGASNIRTFALNYTSNTGNFPASVASLTSSGAAANPSIRVSITIANYGMVNELLQNADTDYVYSGTAGDTDLYDLTDLTVTPASLPLVVSKVVMRKSDTGSRTATTRVKSGATSQDQTTLTLSTTYQWQNSYFGVDPNTSAAWTVSGINAFQIGPKVVA